MNELGNTVKGAAARSGGAAASGGGSSGHVLKNVVTAARGAKLAGVEGGNTGCVHDSEIIATAVRHQTQRLEVSAARFGPCGGCTFKCGGNGKII